MQTERLRIRPPGPDDLQAFLAYRNDPENMRLQPIAQMQEAEALRFLVAQSALDRHADNCWIMFAIERREDGRMIGEVGMYIEPAAKRAGDMGWSLHRDFQGRGYAAEAAAWLVDHAFRDRGLLLLSASMSARNTPSVRVCEHLGMRLESTECNAQQVGAERHDVLRYVLPSSEWIACPPQPGMV